MRFEACLPIGILTFAGVLLCLFPNCFSGVHPETGIVIVLSLLLSGCCVLCVQLTDENAIDAEARMVSQSCITAITLCPCNALRIPQSVLHRIQPSLVRRVIPNCVCTALHYPSFLHCDVLTAVCDVCASCMQLDGHRDATLSEWRAERERRAERDRRIRK